MKRLIKRMSDYNYELEKYTKEEIIASIIANGDEIGKQVEVDFNSFDRHFVCNSYDVCYDSNSCSWEIYE